MSSQSLPTIASPAETRVRCAAFFDIDRTLLAKPSLERRFFRDLRWHGKIPICNYFAWLAEALRIGLADFRSVLHGNKMYLRGIGAEVFEAGERNRANSRLPELFPSAVQRIWWHALRGDEIVIVSGTLAPLAHVVAGVIERELLWRGVDCTVSVIATEVETRDGRLTGRMVGAPVFAEQKAFAIRELAKARNLPLAKCSAYGDSALDRWMLAEVGCPFAVNPSNQLRSIALLRGWQILEWTHNPARIAAEQRSPKWPAFKKKSEAAR